MAIKFSCKCGKNLVIKDDSKAGLRVKCPACGEALTIPAPEAPEEDDELKITEIAPPAAEAPAPAAPAAGAPPQPVAGAPSKCEGCNANIPPGAMFCPSCGAAVVLGPQLKISDAPPSAPPEPPSPSESTSPAPPLAPAAPVDTGPKKECPGCGAQVPESAILCTGCGFNFRTGKKMGTDIT